MNKRYLQLAIALIFSFVLFFASGSAVQALCGGFANTGEAHCNTGNCQQYTCRADGGWDGPQGTGVCANHPSCKPAPPQTPVKCGGFANPGEAHCNTSNCNQYTCQSNGQWSAPQGLGVCSNQAACNSSGSGSGNTGAGTGSGSTLCDPNMPSSGVGSCHQNSSDGHWYKCELRSGSPTWVKDACSGTNNVGGGSTGDSTASTTCSGAYPTAGLCQGKSVGFSPPSMSTHVCVRTTNNWCALMAKSEVGGTDSDGDGITGTVISNNTDQQAAGACPFVVTCQCGGEVKQHCTTANVYGGANLEAHCKNDVCPAPGTGGKVCDPGTVKCLNDGTSRGNVCKNDGSGYNEQPVHAHACGATHTIVSAYCVYRADGTLGACYDSILGCNAYKPSGAQCRTNNNPGVEVSVTDPVTGQITGVIDSDNFGTQTISCENSSQERVFVGCGDKYGRAASLNCYELCSSGSIICEASQMSCGANIDNRSPITPEEPTPSPKTPTSPPPSVPPRTNAPQCTNISKSNAAPAIGDQVSFTCSGAPADLLVRYEFRYGVTTTQSIAEAQLQPLATAQGTPHISVPITVDRPGVYFAQCRPCTANTCLDWEPAELK